MSITLMKYNPQYMFARNKNAKVNLTAYEPLPLEVSSVVGDELTLSSDGKYVVVGNDISYVRVTASLQFVSSSASSQSMMIRRERNGTVVVVATSVGYGTNISLDKTVCMSVVKGDKIQVISNKDSVINSADTGGLRSGLIVEKIC